MSFDVNRDCFRCPNYQLLFDYSKESDKEEQFLEEAGAIIIRSAIVNCSSWAEPTAEANPPDEYILCPADEPLPPLVKSDVGKPAKPLLMPPVPQLVGAPYFKTVMGGQRVRLVRAPVRKV
jgi:hypothetical protein